jgi:DNA polymerase III sliding clamp (beta) subunit (PCNA family)
MLKIKTHVLQNLVSKANAGAGNNKMLPITSMMCINSSNGVLTLCTTDATNYLYVSENLEDKTYDLYVVVPQEQFSKLISRITTDYVTLDVVNGVLDVKGNGIYHIELPLDESGNLITYPDPVKGIDLVSDKSISLGSIKSVLLHNKPSLSTEMDVPCYTGYYMDNSGVISTDTYTMCGNDLKLFDEPVLLSRELVDLLNVFVSDSINILDLGSNLVFFSPSCVVYGAKMKEIGDYQVEALKGLLEQDFPYMVLLPRVELINSLDRLNLFVGKYDKNKIKLSFKDKLIITSKNVSGLEEVEYSRAVTVIGDFECYIDVDMLSTQLRAQEGDVIELYYGKDNAIKMVDGDVTLVLALDEE